MAAEGSVARGERSGAASQIIECPYPWFVEAPDPKLHRRCFIVRDAYGQALAYVYLEEEPGRRAVAHLLTRDEARRIAANIAKLPELLTAPEPNPARAVVLGKWTGNDAPIPSPKFPVREAPLVSVARGFLLPPIRNKTLNGAAAEC
jgi:hypothetical protein